MQGTENAFKIMMSEIKLKQDILLAKLIFFTLANSISRFFISLISPCVPGMLPSSYRDKALHRKG